MWTVAKQVVSAQKAAKLWKGHTAMAGSRKRLNKSKSGLKNELTERKRKKQAYKFSF